MPREVVLHFEDFVKAQEAAGVDAALLAKKLDISLATLNSYRENRWTVLDRGVLERMADLFEFDVSSLVRTTESHFFDPLRQASGQGPSDKPTCLYLRRPDGDIAQNERPLAYRDNKAIDHVAALLRRGVEDLAEPLTSAETYAEFRKAVRQNCVVLGSPMVNPAAEMAICHAFGVNHSDPTARTKLPFTFRYRPRTEQGPSCIVESTPDGKLGIWLRRKDHLFEVDWWSHDQFRRMRINQGRDCAVLLVMNNKIEEPPYTRKLIVLSGFSGAGTEMAARALKEHYRNMEPINNERVVWGIIDVSYQKDPGTTDREELSYSWRCRVGGRCPISFVKARREPAARVRASSDGDQKGV